MQACWLTFLERIGPVAPAALANPKSEVDIIGAKGKITVGASKLHKANGTPALATPKKENRPRGERERLLLFSFALR